MQRFSRAELQSGIKQRKSLGQVFLSTDWPVRRMVEHLQQFSVRRVVEIGPGNGILTFALANAGIHVTAVEKDERFADHLTEIARTDHNQLIDVVHQDVLSFDLKSWIDRGGGAPSAVVGNIPYNISTPIILWALPNISKIELAMFMVQLEFARRIVAQTDTKDYGSLSVHCQLRANCDLNFKVEKACFSPIPKVDSAVITMRSRPDGVTDEKLLQYTESVCRVAFTQRRKKLRNGVKSFMAPDSEGDCPIDLNRRAETLSPGEFVRLAKFLFSHRLTPSNN